MTKSIRKFCKIKHKKEIKALKRGKKFFRKKIYFKKKHLKKKSSSQFSKCTFSDTSSTEINDMPQDNKTTKDNSNNIKNSNNISSNNDNDSNLYTDNIIGKLNNIISTTKTNKINIILDIDQTLIYSYQVESMDKNLLNIGNTADNHFIEFNFDNINYIYFIQVRKGLKKFLSKLSPYCNFYINTMANPSYIKAVLTLLSKKYKLNLCNCGINNVFITNQNAKKTLPPELTKNGNFLILDDNICAWDPSYFSYIIPVKKYYGYYDNINYETIYQYYLFSNKIYTFNEHQRQFFDQKNKLPFCSEASWSQLNQLDYITDLIIKIYLFGKLIEVPKCLAFYNVINNALNGCNVYYDGNDKIFFQELVILMGGKNVDNIKEATHIIYNDKIDKNEIKNYNNVVNIQWIFDSFFSFIKCDESKYKIRI